MTNTQRDALRFLAQGGELDQGDTHGRWPQGRVMNEGGSMSAHSSVYRVKVHAQQTNADGRTCVYHVPFENAVRARNYLKGHHRPERAVLVTRRVVECWQDGRIVSRERVG